MSQQRLLTSSEIDGVLLRNPGLFARVSAHQAIVTQGLWSQKWQDWSASANALLPIPIYGTTWNDSQFGKLVVFPDAVGNLYFSANVPHEVIDQVEKPVYNSPPPLALAIPEWALLALGVGVILVLVNKHL